MGAEGRFTRASDPMDDLRRDVRKLAADVDALQHLILRVAVSVTVAVIISGLIVPIFTMDGVPLRVLTAGLRILSPAEQESSDDEPADDLEPQEVAVGVGFIGLVLVIGVLLVILIGQIASRSAAETSWVRSTALVLAITGTVIANLFALVSVAEAGTDDYGGWGGLLLLAGLALAALIIRSPRWRGLWLRSGPPPHRPYRAPMRDR
ncbi:MAG: hypothetical protein ACK5H2_04180 [Beutenbergiaceae bacterium]